ncbi:MAG TPA: hypothetical protein V6D00_11375 [Pantanalinema sp.]
MRTNSMIALAGGMALCLASAANAQGAAPGTSMKTSVSMVQVPVVSAQEAGPTRYYAVPRASVLSANTNLLSANLFLGGVGIGPGPVGIGINSVSGNAFNLRAEMGMGNNFELGTGIGVLATAPWRGRLDLSGKWGLLSEGQAIAGVAGLAGGILEVDANGTPNLGLQVGLPISKLFAFNGVNTLGLTLVPSWNLGVLNMPATMVGAASGPVNFFGMGIGADLGLMPNLHLLADTSLGFPVAGLNTRSAFGLRYAFNRDTTADLFVGFNSGPSLGLGGAVGSLGLGSSWRF